MTDHDGDTASDGGERYVHDPSAFDTADDRQTTDDRDDHHGKPRGEDREFGLRGWLLVGWLLVALLVVPAYLFFFPRAGETVQLFGLGYRDTYLFVPLLPAVILGVLAVWATTRP